MDIRKLKENRKNPRVIRDAKFKKLVKSIITFPEMMELRPIVATEDGEILGGNMRFRAIAHIWASKTEPAETISTIEGEERRKYLTGYWDEMKRSGQVPVKLASELTEEQRKEFAIKDNASFGEWDWDMLANEWDSADLSSWGVTWEDTELPSSTPLDDIEEDTPPPIREDDPETRLGDIYRLGDHMLVCGDSTDARAYSFMEGNASLLLTDPPYNIGYVGKTPEEMTIANDSQSPEEFTAWLSRAFVTCNPHLSDGAALYVWEAAANEPLFREAFNAAGEWEYRQTLIWVKSHFSLSHEDYHWQHEPCLYGHKGSPKPYFIKNRTLSTIIEDEDAEKDVSVMKKRELLAYVEELREKAKMAQTTVLREKKPFKNSIHPTLKPLKLFGRLVRNSSREGDTVLDIFAGGGTTLVACEKLGRKSYSIELDPRYCDAIMARYWQHTGKDPEKIGNYME